MPSCRQDSEKTLTLTKAADDTEMIERHQQEDLSERLAGDRKSNRRDTRAPITSRKVTMTSIVVSSIIVMIAIVPFCWAFRENTGQAAQVKTDVTNVFNNYNNYIEFPVPQFIIDGKRWRKQSRKPGHKPAKTAASLLRNEKTRLAILFAERRGIPQSSQCFLS